MIYLTNVGAFLRGVLDASKKQGSFSQNFLAVLSGTGVNILVQIIVTPLLTRLYGPEAYGVYALFTALCSNIALIATLRFPQAFIVAQAEKDFHSLMRLSLLSSCAMSVVTFTVLAFWGKEFLRLFQAEGLLMYWFLIPIMVFLITLNVIFGQWQYRLNVFKKSVAIDTSVLLGVRFFNLLFGWLSNGMRIGLIFGDMIGKSTGIVLSIKFIIRQDFRTLFQPLSLKELKRTFVTFKSYPLVNLPGVWFVLTSEQLPFLLLSTKFGLPAIGLLALSISILDLPKRLLAYSVSSVFYKKAVDLYAGPMAEFQAAVSKMFTGLLLLSVVPYCLLVIFGPGLFSFVFGDEWLFSGRVAQYMALYYVLEVICVAFDPLFYTLRKEKQLFIFQFAAFAGRLAVLVTGVTLFNDLGSCIVLLTVFNVILYSAQVFTMFHNMKLPAVKYLLRLYAFMAFVIAIFSGVQVMANYLFD